MSGFTKIDGTNQEIKQGFTSIDGTEYEIKEGWTQVNGNLQKINMSKYHPFSDTSWEDIISACQSESGVPEIWKVGDTKTIDGTSYTAMIIGRNQDTDSSGNVCPLTLQIINGPETAISSQTGVNLNDRRTWNTIRAAMPTALKSGLRTMNKKSWAGASVTGWRLSLSEIYSADYVAANFKTTDTGSHSAGSYDTYEDTKSSYSAYAGTQYEYYAAGNTMNVGWLRSTKQTAIYNFNSGFPFPTHYGTANYLLVHNGSSVVNVYIGGIPNTTVGNYTAPENYAFCL